MKTYLIGVICAGILCACVMALFRKTDHQSKHIRMICGLFLLITVIAPIAKIDALSLNDYSDIITGDGDDIIEDGKQQADEYLQIFIKEQCETYIVEKANGMGVDIDAEIILSTGDTPVPYSATISGAVSPYIKSRLQTILAEDLGIPKERQIWT